MCSVHQNTMKKMKSSHVSFLGKKDRGMSINEASTPPVILQRSSCSQQEVETTRKSISCTTVRLWTVSKPLHRQRVIKTAQLWYWIRTFMPWTSPSARQQKCSETQETEFLHCKITLLQNPNIKTNCNAFQTNRSKAELLECHIWDHFYINL